MDLNQQFQAAAEKVNNLPAVAAGAHMTELYGLFKQATEGDVNMKFGEVDPNAADQANGPAGLSQAQWDSWNQFKGVTEEEAKRRYVARTAEIAGGENVGTSATAATDAVTGAPTGQSTGGLRGDIAAGAPYGGEDLLKEQQAK